MPPLQGLFFTGTDTDVGKTFVMAWIARLLKKQGRQARPCKPVATGVNEQGWNDDTVELGRAASLSESQYREITPWTFPDPAAPPVAARRQGKKLKLSDIVMSVRDRAAAGTALLVEGVGGLLCPLTETETVADLAAALGLPVVIIARRSLGTLNHTLLTIEAARNRQLPMAGLIINETAAPHSLAEETNVEELRRRTAIPVLAVVPYQVRPSSHVPPSLMAVDWWQLSMGEHDEIAQ